MSSISRALGFAALSLLIIGVPGVALADTELFTNNPGFETDPPTTWSQGSFGTVSATYSVGADAHGGTKAGNISVTSIAVGSDAKWVTPVIPVSGGQVITFSDYYKSNILTSVFVYPNAGAPQWIGDAATSSATYIKFTGQTYLVPAGVTSVRFGHVIDHLVGAGPSTLTTDDYSVMLSTAPTQFARGLVTLTFDDGWDTFQLHAKPILDSKGIKTTNYIITGPEGSNLASAIPNGGYMSRAQILQLRNEGFDIQNHSKTHLDLAKDDPVAHGYATRAAMWQEEITNSINALRTFLGPTSVVDSFAYPFGSYCAPTLNDCSEANVKAAVAAVPGVAAARSVDEGYNVVSSDKFALKQKHIINASMPAGAGFSSATVKGWIDFAITNKVWLILMFHDVRPTLAQCLDRGTTTPDLDCTDTATLTDIVNYLSDTTKVPSGTVQTMHAVLSPTPTIAPHANVTAEATSSAGAVVSYLPLPAVTTLGAPTGTATCSPLSGLNFALGTSTVNCTFAGAATTTFSVVVRDTTAPAVALLGSSTVTLEVGNPYVEAGFTATDAVTASTSLVKATTYKFGAVATSSVNTNVIGTYTITYTAKDAANNTGTVVRTVVIGDHPAPIISSQSAGSASQTEVTVTWTTNNPATSRVIYDTVSRSDASTTAAAAPNYGYANSTTEDATLTTNHSVVVSGLSANTTYYFRSVSHGSPSTVSSEMTAATAATPPPGGGSSTPPPSSGGGGGGGGGGSVPIGSISINGNAPVTNSLNVTLSISPAGGANNMWISNDITFSAGSWVPLVYSYPWTLTAGAGTKSVYIRYAVGTTFIASAQDSITYDPSASVTTPSTGGQVLGAQTSCYNFTKTLAVGSRGADVTALQNALTAEGVYSGPVTGVFGPLTAAGVKAYQIKKGLPVVGLVGPMTRAALNTCGASASVPTTPKVLGASTFLFTQTLMIGSRGTEVEELQKRLTSEEVYSGPVTGVFGPLTQAGVKAYQMKKGLPAVGIVGPLTRAVLNK